MENRKKLSVMIIMVITLMLSACSSQSGENDIEEKNSELESHYAQYDEIIEAIENGDYDGAISNIESMKPESETRTVDITLDNYLDYYNLIDDIAYENDADGNIRSATKTPTLELKEDFAIADESSSNVTVGYEYINESRIGFYEFDFQNFTYEPTEEIDSVTTKGSQSASGSATIPLIYCQSICAEQSKYNSSDVDVVQIISEFNISNVSGKLVLTQN